MASPPGSTEPLAARESQIAAHPAVIRGAQAVFISGGWLPTGRVPPMVYPVKSPGMRVGPGFPGASRACLDPETRPRSVACRLSNPEGPRAKQEFGGAPSRSPIVCGTRRDFMVGSALQPGGTARQTGIWWRPLPVSNRLRDPARLYGRVGSRTRRDRAPNRDLVAPPPGLLHGRPILSSGRLVFPRLSLGGCVSRPTRRPSAWRCALPARSVSV